MIQMITNELTEPRCFLFVLFEGGGNVPPILELARGLVQRGHSVRVISDPCNEPEVRLAGCEFTPYHRTPNRSDKSAASTIIKDYKEQDPIKALKVIMDYFCASALACAQDVIEEIEVRPVDLIVVHELIFGAYFAAEKMDIPSVMLIPSCYTFPAPGMPPPGMMPLGGVLGKIRDRVVSMIFQSLRDYVTPTLDAARQALDLPTLPDYFRYFDQLARILVMTSPAFDFKAQLGENVRYVGPVLNDPAWTGEWQSPWTEDDPRPLVLVSFGTTFQNQRSLFQKAIDALDGLPVRGLVTLGPAINTAQVKAPENVVICQSVPHRQVLPFASAVMTHAGHGTVIRALAGGVPLICIPIGRDQPGNAARVVYHKVGLRLNQKASVTDIRGAVQKVIHDVSYHENARRLGKIILEDAQNMTGVQELEEVAIAKMNVFV
jgi:MGT family glycosyltransferase